MASPTDQPPAPKAKASQLQRCRPSARRAAHNADPVANRANASRPTSSTTLVALAPPHTCQSHAANNTVDTATAIEASSSPRLDISVFLAAKGDRTGMPIAQPPCADPNHAGQWISLSDRWPGWPRGHWHGPAPGDGCVLS